MREYIKIIFIFELLSIFNPNGAITGTNLQRGHTVASTAVIFRHRLDIDSSDPLLLFHSNHKIMFKEIWKDIDGYEGLYMVSNSGKIKSTNRLVNQFGHKKNYTRTMRGKDIKASLQNGGYLIVWLSKNGIVKPYTVHRLVASHFIENNNPSLDINHKDGDKKNNSIENLEWCSRRYNIKHSYEILNRRISNTVPVKCIELGLMFPSIKDAAIKTNINSVCISHVINGRNKKAGGYTWCKI